jgi:hypothetical protein
MKPPPPCARSGKRRFPLIEAYFQSDLSDWRGSSGAGDDDDSPARRFNAFNRQFLRESRREGDREMLVLGFIMLIAAWPVFYMLYSVVRLLLSGNPLDL